MDLNLRKGDEVILQLRNRLDEHIQGTVLSAGEKEITIILADTQEKIRFSAASLLSLGGRIGYWIICLATDFQQYKKEEEDKAFAKLLEPIKWSYGTSLGYRKELVSSRREEVRKVYPFLTAKQKKLAKEWMAKEQHSGLWD